jgi:hypothetical protein
MSDTHGCKHDPKCGLWGTGHTDIASGHTTLDIPLFTPVAHGSCRPNTTQQRGEPRCMEDSISKTANRGFQAPIQQSYFTPGYGYRRTAKAKAKARSGDHPCTECDSNWAPAGSQAPARAGRKSGAAQDVGCPIYNVYKAPFVEIGGSLNGGDFPSLFKFYQHTVHAGGYTRGHPLVTSVMQLKQPEALNTLEY